MRLKKYTSITIATIVLLSLIGWSGYAQKKGSGRVMWEYKHVINVSEQDLNALGGDGWEMVGFSVDEARNRFIYFKRAK